MTGRVLAIIPAFNEEDKIASTIRALKRAVDGIDIIVVDDGSTDATASVARDAGVRIAKTGANIGKGGALNLAIDKLALKDDDCLLFLDGDLGDSSLLAAELVEPVRRGEADMTIAGFRARGKSGFGIATKFARWGILKLTGYEAQTPLSGQRALRAGMLKKIGRLEKRFGVEVGLTIDVVRLGGRIREVPLDMRHNETGRDLAGWTHRGRQFLSVLRVLVRKAVFRTRPNDR